MIHPDDRQNVLQSFRSAQEQGKDSSVEHRVIRKDGIQRWVIDRFSWEKSLSGRIVALSGVVSDITEQKQHEQDLQSLNAELERHVAERTAELERANRTKDEFLANMSHELRTPLNSVLGLSEALLEQRQGPLNDQQQKSLQIVEESGRHLLDLINDVLDLSKIEAGKFDFYPQSFSVDDLCRSSLAFIKAQAAKKSIQVTYSNQSCVVNIFADSRRLKQILVNLLTNAVKFTPDNGHVTLEVKTNLDQELIQFSVSDTGVGIADTDLQRLFQPFVQVDSSLNRQYQGTGLGLALVQKLADLHGGSVSVESEVGKGSCFTVNLACPRDIPARLEKPTQEHPGLGCRSVEQGKIRAGSSSPRPVILLAEDNMPNVLTIAEYLESYEYRVVVAHDGLEAITKAEEVSPDLILMDIQMPAMNGLQAIAHLRTNPRFALTPIIALTALAMPGDRERCLAAGASDYLSKPVSLKLLRNSMETMLRMGKG
jgi:signal transduction histidine kinase